MKLLKRGEVGDLTVPVVKTKKFKYIFSKMNYITNGISIRQLF